MNLLTVARDSGRLNKAPFMSSLLELENSPNIFIPEEWSEAAESIVFDSPTSPPPVVLICGAKNCGKSTFSRHLLNVFLQRLSLFFF